MNKICTNSESEEERRVRALLRLEQLYKLSHVAVPPFKAIIHLAA